MRRSAGQARALAAVALAALAACLAPAPRTGAADAREAPARRAAPSTVRVALATAAAGGTLDADGAWRLLSGDGRAVLAHARAGQRYRVERDGAGLAATPLAGGFPAASAAGVLVARPESPDGTVRWNGRRYRGELVVTAGAAGLTVVNRLGVEDYLRGVVPREVGSLAAADRAAIEAQAVAARSYALVRLGGGAALYDLTAGVSNQVYGGADAERPASDAAVAATAGLVLRFGGRVVDAAYHSTCGGSTADPNEVWSERVTQPYLRAVSDRDPRTGRAYCELSPRYAWRRTLDGDALDAAVGDYVRGLGGARAAGRVRLVRVAGHSASGRVAELAIHTDGGTFAVRGNRIRSALRAAGGEILNSTYFTVESMAVGADGRVARLTLRGSGNGHGVGMCQWGAVGRARAGDDYRRILATYYPGTTVGDAGWGADARAR